MPDTDNAMSLTVHVGDDQWHQADSFADAGADDRVFVLDEQGRVRFGDGVAGRRPPDGASVTLSYQEGAGASGHVKVAITTSWPPPESRYLVALGPDGARFRGGRSTDVRAFGAKRVNYFTGQLLGAADFQVDQEYHIGARHRHNRALHGSGIATGLTVTVSGDSSPSLVVEPGLAIDRRGREIELPVPVSVAIAGSTGTTLVLLEYVERQTALIPGSTDTTGTVASRIEEGASVNLCDTDTADPDAIVIARLVFDSSNWILDPEFVPQRCRSGS
jgi:hypothetical protein